MATSLVIYGGNKWRENLIYIATIFNNEWLRRWQVLNIHLNFLVWNNLQEYTCTTYILYLNGKWNDLKRIIIILTSISKFFLDDLSDSYVQVIIYTKIQNYKSYDHLKKKLWLIQYILHLASLNSALQKSLTTIQLFLKCASWF